MGQDQPSKHACNVTGLRNQPTNDASHTNPSEDDIKARQSYGWNEELLDLSDDDSELEEEDEQWGDEDLCRKMFDMASRGGDDPTDEDWVPPKFRNYRKRKAVPKERPKEYVKGPDVMSKSKHSQEHYRKTFCNQSFLDSFIIQSKRSCSDLSSIAGQSEESVSREGSSMPEVCIHEESVEVEIPPAVEKEMGSMHAQNELVNALGSEIDGIHICQESVEVHILLAPVLDAQGSNSTNPQDFDEGWEEDLDEVIEGGTEAQSWDVL
ncbi:hypothetical protein H0H87_008570 [Tephrocybe sp. NHM501043]|nr:hypothetical protein H0H87_008570 [Tephrocybe sp. NHM501043]